MPRPVLRLLRVAAVTCAVPLLALMASTPAVGHGFSSVVYADVSSPEDGVVRAELGLEYDLLVVSAADAEEDDPLFRQGTAAFEGGGPAEQSAVLDSHAETVLAYVAERFQITAEGRECTPEQHGTATVEQREGVPYTFLTLDYHCAEASAHEVTSTLFPDSEGYVRNTKTVVTFDLDLHEGSAALDAATPSFSTDQSTAERFWEFFRLGAEHLLFGLDHILFLLALIAGSRRLREIVLAATTFTLAHSMTFVLAALGLVDVPASVVEPIIALSIAVVAGWYLWRLWRRGSHATDLVVSGTSHLSLDRAGWTRLAVVFCFGLVHGLGFAGALGIDAAWSWQLLWSLLVFNLGIEAVQLGLIALAFPVLALLRHRAPVPGLWITGAVAGVVAVMGLVWFVERVSGS